MFHQCQVFAQPFMLTDDSIWVTLGVKRSVAKSPPGLCNLKFERTINRQSTEVTSRISGIVNRRSVLRASLTPNAERAIRWQVYDGRSVNAARNMRVAHSFMTGLNVPPPCARAF